MMRRRDRWTCAAGWRAIAGMLTVMAMLASIVVAPSGVAAQTSDTSYTFSTGQVLAWDGSWTLDPEASVQEDGLELVLLSQQLSFMAVLSVPADSDMDSTRDAFLDGFLGAGDGSITIDRGSYGAVSYSLDTINYDGVDMGAFTLFRSAEDGSETFAWVFVSLIASFASEFASAQSAFTLDGNPPFTGIEGQGLQDQLEAAVAAGNVPESDDPVSGDDATPTPDAGDLPTPDDDAGDQGNGGLKSNDDAGQSDDATAEVIETETVDSPPTGDVGLVDDSTFISPAYGVTLTWDGNFILDDSRDPNPSANTDGIEIVSLASPTEGTPYFVSVSMLATDSVASDYAAVWSSDEFLEENALSPDAEVLLAEGNDEISAVVQLDFLEDGTPIIYYYEFQVDLENGTLVMYRYFTAAALIETTLPLAQDGIAADGTPALSFFSTDEVVEAAGL